MGASPLITENSEAIISAIRTAASKQTEIQSDKTSFEKVAPVIASMISSVVDLVVAAARNGGVPTTANVSVFIINRGAGFLGLSESQKVLCVGALAELATSVAADGAVFATAFTAEAGTVGAATPVSVPLMIASGASLALAGLKAGQQCGPLVMKEILSLNDDAFKVYVEANLFIGNPSP